MRRAKALLLSTGLLALLTFTPTVAAGQTCVGNCGALPGADGDVSASPFGDGSYQYVTTDGGVTGVALPGVGGTGSATNGSTYTTSLFSGNAGDALNFYFNYVTSDGSGYADYAWARLLNADMSEAALLFTARTDPVANIVPGTDMPAPNANLTPMTVTVTANATNWSPLGSSSGSCWAAGCGNSGWVFSNYLLGTSGNYFLQFGVTNWNDQAYQSGLAFAGATIGGNVIDDPVGVPEPLTGVLLVAGLAGIGIRMRSAQEA